MKYEIVYGNEKKIYGSKELFSFTNKLIEFNIVETTVHKEWEEFCDMLVGAELVLSLKDDLKEETLFVISTEMLKLFDVEVFAIIDEKIKIKLDSLSVFPYSKYDDDQIMRQMGICNGDKASSFVVYYENKELFKYGSYSCGEQKVYTMDKEGSPKDIIVENPELLIEKTQNNQVFYGYNCWLECYFETPNGEQIGTDNEQLQADREYIHGSIADFVYICPETARNIISILKKEDI